MFALLLALNFILPAFSHPLTPRAADKTGYVIGSQYGTDVDDGVCAPLTLLFVRGTLDPGTLGNVIGPPLCGNLSVLLDGNVALQGVPYPATIEGIVLQGYPGGETLTKLAAKARQQCPTTKLALAGYSQGAEVIQYALNFDGLPSDEVKVITYFGDPSNHFNVSGKVSTKLIKEYCVDGDIICQDNIPVVLPPHVTYGDLYGEDAARFIINTTGVSTA